MTFPKRIPQENNAGNAESFPQLMNMTANVELITPEDAQELLAGQSANRQISHGHTDRLRRSLVDKNWYVTSQGIGIDYKGQVIDGQHRLQSIVRTGVSVWMVVVRGLHPTSQRVVDDGRKRSLADDHKIAGHSEYSALAAMQNLAYRFEFAALRGMKLSSVRTIQVSRLEVLEAYEGREEDTANIVRLGNEANKRYDIPGSSFTAAYYLALRHKTRVNPGLIHQFFMQVAKGYGINPGDPAEAIHVAVKRLRSNKDLPSLDTAEICAALLYALDKHLSGEQISRIDWKAVRRRKPRELLS